MIWLYPVKPEKPMKKHNNNRIKNLNLIAGSALILYLLFSTSILSAQNSESIRVLSSDCNFKPMENVVIICTKPGVLQVKDSRGREYFRSKAATTVLVPVAGATGTHTALLLNDKGITIDSAQFNVQTETSIEDGGQTGEMFRLFHQGMLVYDPDGVSEISWNGYWTITIP
jgi:hypothetical protein